MKCLRWEDKPWLESVVFIYDQENTHDYISMKQKKEHPAEGQGTFLIRSFGLCVGLFRSGTGPPSQGRFRKSSRTKRELHLAGACDQIYWALLLSVLGPFLLLQERPHGSPYTQGSAHLGFRATSLQLP